jgi:mono/diheme cytochrome c family protein
MGWRRSSVAGLVGAALVGLGAAVGACAVTGKTEAASPQAAEFFEARVRPVLAENCYSCHGPAQQMAGLRLDSRASVLKGSMNGPVLVPGDPEKSALIRAIRYNGAVKMPPPGKLPNPVIETLTAWVKIGAPWPSTPISSAAGSATPASGFVITAAQKRHWAFQPVRKPPLPAVKNKAWLTSPIDGFVLAKLEQKGLRPARPADKLTLLRRATFDLTGLPPTVPEIDAYLADHSPDAFARVVDRLLASPRYGERWGRHWLDVARYADTKGYSFTEDSHYPNAYTYRDYVIRAFNQDVPYNQFILQQLAADQLALGGDQRPLAAMGYLTVGRRFLNNEPDIIDDRIDVVCRGLMGLTVSCARCHNHKFDPIPTKDYYSLYGVFASSVEPAPAIISPPSVSEPYLAHEKLLKDVEQQAGAVVKAQQNRLLLHFRSHVADYLLASVEGSGVRGQGSATASQGSAAGTDLNPRVLQRWQRYLREEAHRPIFGPWMAAVSRGPSAVSRDEPALTGSWQPIADSSKLNPLVARMLAGSPPLSLHDLAQRYGELFTAVDRHWRDLLTKYNIAAAIAQQNGEPAPRMPTFLPDPAEETLREVLYGGGSPVILKAEDLEPSFEPSARDALASLRQKAAKLRETMPPAPEYAMVLEDAKEPYHPHVFLRGNPRNHGDEVPRQFPLILAGENRRPFQHGSGRLELAQAIASKDNPLTARVMVNRIWLHHFGEGLVRTPSDFGMRSEPPTDPELLDYLAARFIDMGWSIKRLQRLIMLSSTYQMSSDDSAQGRKLDPENRLLWRMNRRRLELEPLRDAMLAVSGQLDTTMGGPAVEITKPPYSPRRTVYGFIDRQNLQGLFRTFDLASPDATNAQRHETTVPQQALFMMNSPFVVDQARLVAARPDVVAMTDPARRVRYLYRLLFGRLPTTEEVALGLSFVQSSAAASAVASAPQSPIRQVTGDHGGSEVALASVPSSGTGSRGPATEAPSPLSPWERYIQVLLMTNEFAFVD